MSGYDEYTGAGTVAELMAKLQSLTETDPAAAGYRIALAGCDCYGPWNRDDVTVDETDRTVSLERRDERDIMRDNEGAG